MKKILLLFIGPALFAATPQYQSPDITVPAAEGRFAEAAAAAVRSRARPRSARQELFTPFAGQQPGSAPIDGGHRLHRVRAPPQQQIPPHHLQRIMMKRALR